ncbi:hypothetical protein [Burkholderia ubonensis]|uniref:Uncharacterized protein n=1 Tax=Burkholderia ubonensis subsp. mesacidophila TaxID=265293 RepID=A0A2A4FA94_9BURK|nr:hypothetical protein [Burkholderia ubonensis]PCE30055.1 hypothetical protein BZL54_23100 [Burkholderia ubonensis subsp. mesacidophila]
MTDFERKAQGIFARFTEKLAKVDLRAAVATPTVVGAVTATADTNVKEGELAPPPASAGNMQARGARQMFAASLLSAASITLARGFERIKAAFHEKGEQQRVEATKELIADAPVHEDGHYAWARERTAGRANEQDWRSRFDTQMREPPGTVEMLRRVALAHQVNVRDLEIRGNEVVLNTPRGRFSAPESNDASPYFRPICRIDSPFWRETERQVYILNRYARAHDLHAQALYVRNGVVFEENPESFVDRQVCNVDSIGWDAAHRALIDEELGHRSPHDLVEHKQMERDMHGSEGTPPNDRARVRFT